MKTLFLSALAVTIAASPLAATVAQAAPQHHQTTAVRERANGAVVTRTTTRYRSWAPGQRFDRRQAQNYRVISDWRGQRLTAPGRGQRYVRSGRDVVLIRDNGTVVRVIPRRF